MRKLVKHHITFLLFGLGFWLPVAVLFFIIALLFSNLEDIGRKILLVFLPEKFLHSGFGIVFGILIVYFSGIALELILVQGWPN